LNTINNPLPDIRKPDVPKRKRSSAGHCLKYRYTVSFPSHRFPFTFPHRDTSYDIIIIPNQILYIIFFYFEEDTVDIAIHTRAHIIITPRCPLNGTIGRFPTDTLLYNTCLYIDDDDPFPLRSTLFRTLAGHPFFDFFKRGTIHDRVTCMSITGIRWLVLLLFFFLNHSSSLITCWY